MLETLGEELAYQGLAIEDIPAKVAEDAVETGKTNLDARVDVIMGAHSHCHQGMEYYESKTIIYKLGNY